MRTYLFCSLALLAGAAQAAEDVRQLAPMPAAAAANLGAEMRANLLALNEILSLVAAGKLKEAGELAEKELGIPRPWANIAVSLSRRVPGRTCRRRCTRSASTGTRRRASLPVSPPAVTGRGRSPRYRR
jgi:hypothetical protein